MFYSSLGFGCSLWLFHKFSFSLALCRPNYKIVLFDVKKVILILFLHTFSFFGVFGNKCIFRKKLQINSYFDEKKLRINTYFNEKKIKIFNKTKLINKNKLKWTGE